MKPEEMIPGQNPPQPGQQSAPLSPQQQDTASQQVSPGFLIAGIPEPSRGSGLLPSLPNVNATAGGPILPPRRSKKKMLVIIATLLVLLFGASVAAYYGIIVPNKPENIWKTALSRTSQGYDRLVNYQDQYKDMKGMTVKGSYKASGALATDGSFEAQLYNKDATVKFDVGALTTRVNIESRFIANENSKNPDIYVKASGLKGFSATLGEEYGKFLEQLDSQWYVIDHTLLDNLENTALKQTGTEATGSANLTADDLMQVQKAIGEVNRQYMFTDDPNKAVLTVVSHVGKEQRDGRGVYHYKVGLHKQHTKDYANALMDRLQNTPLKKMLNGKKLRDVVDMSELTKTIDTYSETDTADVYVDDTTKLISNVRIQDKKEAANYMELAVPYASGDVLPITMTLHGKNSAASQASSMALKLNTDLKQFKGDMSIDFSVAIDSKTSETGNFKMTFSENKTALNLEKPTDAKSLNELLGGLNLGGSTTATDLTDSIDNSSSI